MRIIWTFFGLIILLIGIGFALLNTGDVTLFYYLGVVKAPLSLIVVLAFIVGGLVGLGVGFVRGKRRK